jgi:rare lipoprotein A
MNSRKFPLPLFLPALVLAFAALTGFTFTQSAEFGKATYYANSLHGRKTASGEKYDRTLLTCAHKTYPFGTILRVTRLDNQQSVEVRVNDRGPYAEGFVVDISYKAAEAIDLIKAGVTKVKVELVEKAGEPKAATSATSSAAPTVEKAVKPAAYSATPSTNPVAKTVEKAVKPAAYSTSTQSVAVTAPTVTEKSAPVASSELYSVDVKKVSEKGFGVQLMTVSNGDSALKELAKLQATWPGKVLVNADNDGSTTLYKIIVGPYPDRKAAEAQQRVATKKGHAKCFVVQF